MHSQDDLRIYSKPIIQEPIKICAENAPYLAESLNLYPDIAVDFIRLGPDALMKKIEREIPENIGPIGDEMTLMRQAKRRRHLAIALADVSGQWNWARVTASLTAFADLCMRRFLVSINHDMDIQPLKGGGTIENPVPGLFILAVGKYGAGELNYSSDIDFNVFYDSTALRLARPERAERTLIKVVQALVKAFERVTEHGYVFRTDLRLRPDPRSTSVAVSTQSAERYYETLGQNWERAAMIKARVCGGDSIVGDAFVRDVLTPFIWRRSLDYETIDDIMAMKRQMSINTQSVTLDVLGHNLKLGVGGIREIEFYAQVQQLILGGRHLPLRLMCTLDALEALRAEGFVEDKACEILSACYARLRDWEHRLQMIRDAQTHTVPQELGARQKVGRLSGFSDVSDFDRNVQSTLRAVHRIFTDLFVEAESLTSRAGTLVFTGVDIGDPTHHTLNQLGFTDPGHIWRVMSQWLGGRIPATRTSRARQYLTRLAPVIIDACADTGRPDEAFGVFGGFISSLSGGVSILSMFTQEPERLRALIRLMVQSPLIAERVSEQPTILDAMADPDFSVFDVGGMFDTYMEEISRASDFEGAMNTARRLAREDRFRISAGCLSGQVNVHDLAPVFTGMADASISALMPLARQETVRRFGEFDGSFAVLGLGKLGGQEMRMTSDLDIMMIYSPSVGQADAVQYYARLTQSLITALSAYTTEGGLFEVDMALRPSGRAGPVAVSLEAFETYYARKAWSWEFMALSRARIIATHGEGFFDRLEQARRKALCAARPDLDMNFDISDMLRRTRAQKPARNIWDIKNHIGGLRDIEFIAQKFYVAHAEDFVTASPTSTHDMLANAARLGVMSQDDVTVLQNAEGLYKGVSQVMSLMTPDIGKVDITVSAECANILGFKSTKALISKLSSCYADVAKRVDQHVLQDTHTA